MGQRTVRTALITFAVADTVPAVVLALTFYAPFLELLVSRGAGRSVPMVRVACVVALVALALLIAFRERVAVLLERVDAHVRSVAATAGAEAIGQTPRRSAMALIVVAAACGIVTVGLAATATPGFRAMIAEDGPVEYASALSWFAAAACALGALLLDRRAFRRKLAFYLPIIALCVMAGGEEISWGQRLLGYGTPDWLAANKQREFNLHDIGSISVTENAFFVFTTLCLLVVPWALGRAPAWHLYLRRLNAPIFDPMVARVYAIGLAVWVSVGVRFGTLGFSPLSLWGHYTQSDDEIWEFYAAFGFLALAALDLMHRVIERRGPARVAPRPTLAAVPVGDGVLSPRRAA